VKSIYLGNLPLTATEDEVKELFGQHGEVGSVTLMAHTDTGKSRGFGFVEMDPDGAVKAIDALDGTEFGGHTLRVNEARDRGAKAPRRSW
jgi:RNA recognition motif-containing protein